MPRVGFTVSEQLERWHRRKAPKHQRQPGCAGSGATEHPSSGLRSTGRAHQRRSEFAIESRRAARGSTPKLCWSTSRSRASPTAAHTPPAQVAAGCARLLPFDRRSNPPGPGSSGLVLETRRTPSTPASYYLSPSSAQRVRARDSANTHHVLPEHSMLCARAVARTLGRVAQRARARNSANTCLSSRGEAAGTTIATKERRVSERSILHNPGQGCKRDLLR